MDDRLADIKARLADTGSTRQSDAAWLIEQVEQARRWAVALENDNARLAHQNEHLLREHATWIDGCRTSCHNQQGGGTHA